MNDVIAIQLSFQVIPYKAGCLHGGVICCESNVLLEGLMPEKEGSLLSQTAEGLPCSTAFSIASFRFTGGEVADVLSIS